MKHSKQRQIRATRKHANPNTDHSNDMNTKTLQKLTERYRLFRLAEGPPYIFHEDIARARRSRRAWMTLFLIVVPSLILTVLIMQEITWQRTFLIAVLLASMAACRIIGMICRPQLESSRKHEAELRRWIRIANACLKKSPLWKKLKREEGKKGRRGTPIEICTNIEPGALHLPQEGGIYESHLLIGHSSLLMLSKMACKEATCGAPTKRKQRILATFAEQVLALTALGFIREGLDPEWLVENAYSMLRWAKNPQPCEGTMPHPICP